VHLVGFITKKRNVVFDRTLDMEEKRNITKDLPSVQSYVGHYTPLCTGTQ